MKMSFVVALALGLASVAAIAASPRVGGDYVYTGEIDAGGPGFWDYAALDAERGRLYVTHVDKVSVLDTSTRQLVGSVGPLSKAHGVAIVAALQKGYASSGGDGLLKVFDLGDLHIVKDIPVGDDADGVIFDPHSDAVIVMTGDSKRVAIVDPHTDAVVRSVDLPANPEFGAADGRGKLYVNLVTTDALAKIDIATGHIDAVWPLTGCRAPHGLVYDPTRDRLFSTCFNKVLVVVDPASGALVATLPIGAFSDDAAVDTKRHRVFSPNGDGTLTVIREDANDRYAVERTIPTFLGGRSMALDPRTGTLYVTHGDTHVKGERTNALELRFGWDNALIATFVPND